MDSGLQFYLIMVMELLLLFANQEKLGNKSLLSLSTKNLCTEEPWDPAPNACHTYLLNTHHKYSC